MIKNPIFPPDLDDLFDEIKTNIFSNINCIQIGKIETVNKSEQTAQVQIQVKRRVNETDIISYPLLIDCPIIVSQGGGSYIDFPIQTGDYCLLLFNDRDIDNWWSAGTEKEPATLRKHSLSDAFVLVGINPKINVLSLDGTNLDIWGPAGSDRIRITPAGNIELGTGGNSVARKTDTTKLTLSVADINTLAVALLATTAFTPTGSPPAYVGPPLVFTGGEITGGSSEVTSK